MKPRGPKIPQGYALCKTAKDAARAGVEYWDGKVWLPSVTSAKYRPYKNLPYIYPISKQSRLALEQPQK